MRKFFGFLCTVISVLLIFVLLFTCVQLTVLDRKFYSQEYIAMDTARNLGMSQNELMRVTDHLLNVLTGDEQSMSIKAKINGKNRNAFDDRESQHMVDVVALYQTAENFRNIAAVVVAIVLLLTVLAIKKDRLELLSKSYVVATCIVGAIFVGFGVWIAIDFNSFWNSFHYAFFSNDLWLLDPRTSLMINMFPENFWFDVCRRILLFFASSAGALLLASLVYLKYRSHRRKQVMSIRDGE